MRRCMRRATDAGARVFRNNVGVGWTGTSRRLPDQSILITDPRPLHAGLAQGSADLIGWMPVVVTADMVGQVVAVFTSVETKTARGRATDAQKRWAQVVAEAGGLSGIARTDADLDKILRISGIDDASR